MNLLTVIKTKLVDGRDFLDGSKVLGDKLTYDIASERILKSISELSSLGVEFEFLKWPQFWNKPLEVGCSAIPDMVY